MFLSSWLGMRRNARRPRVQLCVDRLEYRTVPAGNVTAFLDSMDGLAILRIEGDSAGNNVSLRGGTTPGSVEVKGIGTTVNSGNEAVTFSGIDWLEVDVADGNDTVHSHRLSLSRILVFGGAGNDTVELRGTYSTPGGLDYVVIEIRGDYSDLAPGQTNGDDTMTVANTTLTDKNFYIGLIGDLTFPQTELGGHDTIRLENTTVSVNPSPEDFYYYFVDIFGGGFADSEPGDEITVSDFQVTGNNQPGVFVDLFIFGSSGDDTLRVRNCSVGTMFAGLGEGNDRAVITNNTFGFAEVDGGSGVDRLIANHNSAVFIAFLDFEEIIQGP